MGKSEMKNVTMIMVIIMAMTVFIFVQANDSPSPFPFPMEKISFSCAAECGTECIPEVETRILYAKCLADCEAKCGDHSKFNNVNIGMLVLSIFYYIH